MTIYFHDPLHFSRTLGLAVAFEKFQNCPGFDLTNQPRNLGLIFLALTSAVTFQALKIMKFLNFAILQVFHDPFEPCK